MLYPRLWCLQLFALAMLGAIFNAEIFKHQTITSHLRPKWEAAKPKHAWMVYSNRKTRYFQVLQVAAIADDGERSGAESGPRAWCSIYKPQCITQRRLLKKHRRIHHARHLARI